jgi:hypothetical protein
VNQEQIELLKTVLSYVLDAERQHFEESGEPAEHIYALALKALNDYPPSKEIHHVKDLQATTQATQARTRSRATIQARAPQGASQGVEVRARMALGEGRLNFG